MRLLLHALLRQYPAPLPPGMVIPKLENCCESRNSTLTRVDNTMYVPCAYFYIVFGEGVTGSVFEFCGLKMHEESCLYFSCV